VTLGKLLLFTELQMSDNSCELGASQNALIISYHILSGNTPTIPGWE